MFKDDEHKIDLINGLEDGTFHVTHRAISQTSAVDLRDVDNVEVMPPLQVVKTPGILEG